MPPVAVAVMIRLIPQRLRPYNNATGLLEVTSRQAHDQYMAIRAKQREEQGG